MNFPYLVLQVVSNLLALFKLWLQLNKTNGHIMSVFHSLSSMEGPLKQFLMSRGTPSIVHVYRTENKERVAYGNYCSTVNRLTKIPAIFQGIFGIFHGILKCLCIYCTTSGGTSDYFLWKPDWETPLYMKTYMRARYRL
jgi:hypothetical protein